MSKSSPSDTWNANFFELSPMFTPLLPFIQIFKKMNLNWPTLGDYNAGIQRTRTPSHFPVSGGGFPVQFVKQSRAERCLASEHGIRSNYQLRIFFTGEVPSRLNNWHDFFNMLSWQLFPQTKAVLNRRHFLALDESLPFPWCHIKKNRNAEQDMLTIFDEAGVVVVSSDPTLWQLLQEHRYRELFVHRRSDVKRNMRFLVFGHAIYETVVRNTAAPVGAGMYLRVTDDFWQLPEHEQNSFVDANFALRLANRTHFIRNQDFAAVPVLGFPGFVAKNEHYEYYSNQDYFRSKS